MKNNAFIIADSEFPILVPQRIMVFAGHPDDEIVSCGGTLLKYQELGSQITVVIATAGIGGYAKPEDKENIAFQREKELTLVSEMLKCEFIELRYSDMEIKRSKVSKITNLIRDFKPHVLFIPHHTDFHRVHRNLSLICREAIYHCSTGKAYGGHGKGWQPMAVYYYESPSCKFQYTQGKIFVIVDIENYWEKKREIFDKIYISQKEVLERVLDWAEDTAILRGNEINSRFGEGFIPETTYTPLRIILV